jgi:DNA-binding transcriptional ArsR family regulator
MNIIVPQHYSTGGLFDIETSGGIFVIVFDCASSLFIFTAQIHVDFALDRASETAASAGKHCPKLQIQQIWGDDLGYAGGRLPIHNMQPTGCMLWDNSSMDEVFKALADTSRRRLLDSLTERDGQSLRELCAGLSMARQSVSKHLAVLEVANLVTTTRHGREKLHHLNAEPIRTIAERWIVQYGRAPERTPNQWIDWHDALVQP